jgi:hypothetical protein
MALNRITITAVYTDAFAEIHVDVPGGYITVNINGISAQFPASSQGTPDTVSMMSTLAALNEAMNALPGIG